MLSSSSVNITPLTTSRQTRANLRIVSLSTRVLLSLFAGMFILKQQLRQQPSLFGGAVLRRPPTTSTKQMWHLIRLPEHAVLLFLRLHLLYRASIHVGRRLLELLGRLQQSALFL